jgi:hypothetical protein
VSARSDAATDRVTIASAPAAGPITVCTWAKLVTQGTSTLDTIVRWDASGTTSLIMSLRGASGLTPGIYSAASTTGVLASSDVTLGTWVFIAGTRDGSSNAQIFWGTNPASLSKVTGTVNTSGTPSSVNLFGRSTSDATDWFNGSLAHFRVWTTVLTDAEVAAEGASATLVKTASAWSAWEFANAALTDSSGNSRNLTAGSTGLTADADPLASAPFVPIYSLSPYGSFH